MNCYNKVTQEDIDGCIKSWESLRMGEKTTVVLVTLVDGFEIVGSSACVDPENYCHETGTKIALERAKETIWLLKGYELQQKRCSTKECCEQENAA